MLLMVVVVAAVGTFSYFLAYTQSQSQSRSVFLASVANEKLQIPNIQLAPSNPLIQYEIYQITNQRIRFYIQMITSTSVDLINETTGFSRVTTLNSSLDNPPTNRVFTAYYNSINFSTTANLYERSPFWNITFISPTAVNSGNCSFRIATWNNATIAVRNLNTQSAGIKAIQVDGSWLSNSWYIVNSNGSLQKNFPYNFSSTPLTLPAKASANIFLNLTYLSIARIGGLQIVLETSASNFFTTSYGAPTATIPGERDH